MVGHLFQNYDTIYVRFFPTYTCNHSYYTIYVRFFATYTCVLSCFVGFLFASIIMIIFLQTLIYMRTKKVHIQLFREGLSEKVHAPIPKGIVGSFEFAVPQRNLKEWHERPLKCVCEFSSKATKVGSTVTVSGTVY